VFSGVFTAEAADGIGEKGSRDITMVYVQITVGGLFEHVPVINLFP
jgi:hypothetical protein